MRSKERANAMENPHANEAELACAQYPWFALQVRTKHELSVANLLRGIGYAPFVPLYQCRKRWSDRIKVVDAPLFPGYLFCRLNLQNRLPVLMTPGVTQIVGYSRVPIPVDEAEINAIQMMVASGLPNQPWPFLQVGDRVQIERGPLGGLEGILLEVRGAHRLILSVTLLQRSVAVQIDPAFVKLLRPAPPPQIHANEHALQLASQKDVGTLG
jgi:transcription antitermination factor NusG